MQARWAARPTLDSKGKQQRNEYILQYGSDRHMAASLAGFTILSSATDDRHLFRRTHVGITFLPGRPAWLKLGPPKRPPVRVDRGCIFDLWKCEDCLTWCSVRDGGTADARFAKLPCCGAEDGRLGTFASFMGRRAGRDGFAKLSRIEHLGLESEDTATAFRADRRSAD